MLELVDRLERFYGALQQPPSDPFTFYVWDVVGVRTSRMRRDAAMTALRRIPALTPDSMGKAPRGKLEAAVAFAGPYREERLRALASGIDVFKRQRDLPAIFRGAIDAAREALSLLPHMNTSSGQWLLLFAGHQPVFPDDAHIQRVFERLGIEPMRATEQCGDVLTVIQRSALYVSHHGRSTCVRDGSVLSHLPAARGLPVCQWTGRMRTIGRIAAVITALSLPLAIGTLSAAGPAFVDITWMSISNMYYELGSLNVVTDGYITRLPQDAFFGGGGGLAQTRQPFKPDLAAVTRVMNALGRPTKVNLLLTGHSHWDHSFDTATWSKLTGARIIGSKTTCLQAQAEGVPVDRCQAVNGRETIRLADGVTMRVVRWNHSGDPAVNPEQHNPVELSTVPVRDPETGGLRAGVAEDFPNGGGNRAYLFTVDGPDGRFSWFFSNSASAVDLHIPIVVDGVDYGAPIENLRAAMKDAGLASVDLWIGSSALPALKLVVPVLKPKNFLPVHWDGLWGAFEAGVPKPYADAAVDEFLGGAGTSMVKPVQYMDKWRLDRSGIRPVPNPEVKKALGFN